MARGDAAFRAVSATLFAVSLAAGGWLTVQMVAGFQKASEFADEQKRKAAAAAGGEGA